MKWCTQTFPTIFRLSAIFNRNFVKIVAPPSNKNKNYLVHLKGQSLLLKNAENGIKIDKKNSDTKPDQSIPLGWTAHWPRSVTKDKQKTDHKHHIFAPIAGVRYTIFPKLCMVIEHVDTIKKALNHFSIHCIVFPTGCTEKFGLNDQHAVSQQ